jgi:hypothetical protein
MLISYLGGGGLSVSQLSVGKFRCAYVQVQVTAVSEIFLFAKLFWSSDSSAFALLYWFSLARIDKGFWIQEIYVIWSNTVLRNRTSVSWILDNVIKNSLLLIHPIIVENFIVKNYLTLFAFHTVQSELHLRAKSSFGFKVLVVTVHGFLYPPRFNYCHTRCMWFFQLC